MPLTTIGETVNFAAGTMTDLLTLDELGLLFPSHGAAGAPTTGTWAKGQVVGDDNAVLWICTTAGTPGTWIRVGNQADLFLALAGGTMTGLLTLDNLGAVFATHGAAGAPTTGTWAKGQVVGDDNAVIWVCTAAGTPGTWEQVGSDMAADSVNDTHIDWGTGANQVSAADVPIADTGGTFAATDVEGALAELVTEKLALTGGVLTGSLGLTEQPGDPAGIEDQGYIYTKADGSDTELYFADDDGTATKITVDGKLYLGANTAADLPIADTGGTFTATDVEAALAELVTEKLAADGSVTATADIPMGGFSLTGLAAGAAAGESLRYEQVAMCWHAHHVTGWYQNPGSTYYHPLTYRDNTTGTGTRLNVQWKAYRDLVFTNLRVNVVTNTANGNNIWLLEDDGAATALSITHAAGVTGVVEDTDTVSVAAGSLMNYSLQNAGGSGTALYFMVQVEALCG